MRGELHLRYQRQSHARGGDSLNTERQMAWDELNRLMALPVNDKSRHYTYNAASERMSLKILIPATTRHLKVECVI